MSKQRTDARERVRNKQISLGEVFDILNDNNIPLNVHAQSRMIWAARYPFTIKRALRKAWAYTRAFFPALIYTINQSLNVRGKYSKGGVISGRKDM